jgi:hypothetical protein
MNKLKIIILFIFLTACNYEEEYKKGYDSGYEKGYLIAKSELERDLKECNDDLRKKDSSSYSYDFSGSVCGGGVVTINGKEIKPDKDGCVTY